MTWEDTIIEIRSKPEFIELVREAYFSDDLVDNVKRFRNSNEFKETIKELKSFNPILKGKKLLDIGAGNGISSIAFALEGIIVTALEPDPSDVIGANAIRRNIDLHKLSNEVTVVEEWGESLPFTNNSFDFVYGRQVMHHAHDLSKFVQEGSRVLKANGIFMTTRDHVVKNNSDKEAFLKRHPLHKFYGGENAFTLIEYSNAITNAKLTISRSYDAFQSAINYDPWNEEKVSLKFGFIGKIPLVATLLLYIVRKRLNNIPGRLHTFVAVKNI